MIARTRRRLLRAARAFAKDGKVPPGVDEPGIYTQVRSGEGLVSPASSSRAGRALRAAHTTAARRETPAAARYA